MKSIISLCSWVVFSATSQAQLDSMRGISAFAFRKSEMLAEIKKSNGEDEVICIYRKNDPDKKLVLSVKEVFAKSIRYPLFVDAKIFDDDLIVLLELQPPISHFLRQRYKRVNSSWVLVAENPIQMMNIIKRQKLVAGKIVSKEEVVFYFHPRSEYEKIEKRILPRGIKRGEPHKEDYKMEYQFSDFTKEDEIAFGKKAKGLFLEVLGDHVQRNNQEYDFRNDDSSQTSIPGY